MVSQLGGTAAPEVGANLLFGITFAKKLHEKGAKTISSENNPIISILLFHEILNGISKCGNWKCKTLPG